MILGSKILHNYDSYASFQMVQCIKDSKGERLRARQLASPVTVRESNSAQQPSFLPKEQCDQREVLD